MKTQTTPPLPCPWEPETEKQRQFKLDRAAHSLRMMTEQQANIELANFILSSVECARAVYEMGKILDRRYSQGSEDSQALIASMSAEIKKNMRERLGIDFDAIRTAQTARLAKKAGSTIPQPLTPA